MKFPTNRLIVIPFVLVLPIVLLIAAGNASSDRIEKMSVVINFDVEDYISPESEGIDDIPKWLAEIMTEEGVKGTFFVIGEKARSLVSRGRRDVIAVMAKHDIGSHTNFGSIHPTVTEILEKADGPNGMKEMREREGAGFRELQRIFGVPVMTMGRHGGSYGPQLVAALGKMGVGYAGSPIKLPGKSVVWFCNALNFSGQYDGFDDTYWRDDLFDPLLDKLAADFPTLSRTVEMLPLFAGHPCRIRTIQFWDLNYYKGVNTVPAEWKTPEMRPRESMATAQKNFRRLIRALKDREDVELTTFRELMGHFGSQKEIISALELDEIARRTLKEKRIVTDEYFSPAEAFAALVTAISEGRRAGTMTPKIKVRHALGPWEVPPSKPHVTRVGKIDIDELADMASKYIDKFGSIPASLEIEGRRIGTGSLFVLFCAAYLDLRSGAMAEAYDIPSFDPYPRIPNEDEIMDQILSYKTWPVHRPDLNMDRIVELTKLQLWTLKPAQKR